MNLGLFFKLMEDDSEFLPDIPSFTSFSSILDLYYAFLRGEIPECPTYDSPLDEETKDILDELLFLNRADILTIESQPGRKGEDYVQRAYLDCYMKDTTYRRLEDRLQLSGLKIFFSVVDRSEEEIIERIPVTVDDDKEIHVAMPISKGWPMDLDVVLLNTREEEKDEIVRNLYHVQILDPVWGRWTYLFERVVTALN